MDRINLLNRTLNRIDRGLNSLHKKSSRLAWIRLTIVLTGIVFILLALIFSNEFLSGAAVFILIVVFGSASLIHRKVKKTINNYEIWRSIKKEHLNRATLNWKKIPYKNYDPNINHPYAVDLDITGEFSLHRLIDNTATMNGSERLLDWFLKTDPEPETIIHRQEMVKAMIPLIRFRDKLKMQSQIISRELFNGKKFTGWLNKLNDKLPGKFYIWLLNILAIINIILFGLDFAGLIPPYYTITFTIYVLLFLSKSKIIGSIFWEAINLNDEIHKISGSLLCLENYPLPSGSPVTKLLSPIRKAEEKPSRYLKRLLVLMGLFGFRANIVIQISLNIILPVDYILAAVFTIQKNKIKQKMPVWLDCWYELESINALADFAWLNPDYTFPGFVTDNRDKKSIFAAQRLGHPLIPKEIKKVNDFEITTPGDIALITGSNMSGKSTFLRTVGINICMAQAGGVVNAANMQIQFTRLFTCIKINDNLSEGLSYFYAEVKRLRELLNRLEKRDKYPLFYLIDEIYKGTNNQERLKGSRAFIKALEQKYGAGIVSTHDLELIGLESEMKSLKNFHFQEHIENGKMIFDFQLHEGPCPTTNALVIMRNEGLPTD
jgi:hypothetical protein